MENLSTFSSVPNNCSFHFEKGGHRKTKPSKHQFERSASVNIHNVDDKYLVTALTKYMHTTKCMYAHITYDIVFHSD